MPKSKIIKELANSEIDTVTALKRLKVLLFKLKKDEVNLWLSAELNGYKNSDGLPDYRIYRGQATGSFIIGRMKYQNTPIPLSGVSKELREDLLKVCFRESISAISSMQGETLHMTIPPEYYPYLTKGNNIDGFISVKITVPQTAPTQIINAVEDKVLEILCLLEDEFGLLDELDIDFSVKPPEELERVCQNIINIISIDNSISIGNDNKITKSKVGSKS